MRYGEISARGLLAVLARNRAIGAGEEHRLRPVLPPDDVRRRAVGAPHFGDHPMTRRFTDMPAVYRDFITNVSLHRNLPAERSPSCSGCWSLSTRILPGLRHGATPRLRRPAGILPRLRLRRIRPGSVPPPRRRSAAP
ncbi:hypothetical protein Acel_1960 [Acidothermus cellulolyticus 11B]|uniref:Uncharacterized protein n=1 Tax=Acidothermus cellulolyticus (strain ATCC 43068 / DSM 8971 / 11B) TaxID=351607 RepID=A0LWC2_ACIC1|nr:hypothetical protein Acel_1960 [Acidothermus cellulolyticus 11B]